MMIDVPWNMFWKKTQSFWHLPKSITQIPYGLMTSMKSTLIYGNRMQLMSQVREL